MKELKCPKCGNVFQVDEADYASIVSQVKNAEFDAEINRRMSELHDRHKAEQELATTKIEQDYHTRLNKKDLELGAKDAEIERMRTETTSLMEKLRSEKDAEIIRLKSMLESIESKKNGELDLALSEKEKTIAELKAAISQNDTKLQLAIMEERAKAQQNAQTKDVEIQKLKSAVELEKREARIHEDTLNKEYEEKLRANKEMYEKDLKTKQEMIDYYKDMKTKMSTKMVGETLEQHCSIEFEQYIRPMMPNAFFDKDNDVKEGTKGDFIFRDYEDGIEYISIMFEMKNEADTTATKHKNEDFLKKLDEDRKKKDCEFAVLVSLLEADNDLYNNGIVNKSHLYPKMYVIRPQFFVPFINLLVQTSKKSLEYRRQLALAQSKEVDVTNFEKKIEEFKSKFGRHYELASKKFGDAIKQIDETIAKLMKVKESLIGSEKNLSLAQKDTENLTIRKLTYNNQTMKAKFEEARKTGDVAVPENFNEQ